MNKIIMYNLQVHIMSSSKKQIMMKHFEIKFFSRQITKSKRSCQRSNRKKMFNIIYFMQNDSMRWIPNSEPILFTCIGSATVTCNHFSIQCKKTRANSYVCTKKRCCTMKYWLEKLICIFFHSFYFAVLFNLVISV